MAAKPADPWGVAVLRGIPERDWQATVVQYARLCGWLVFHPWQSTHSAAGYPDLTLVHTVKQRIVWVECKTERGKLTIDQETWRAALSYAGGEVYVLRPSDAPRLEALFGPRTEAVE